MRVKFVVGWMVCAGGRCEWRGIDWAWRWCDGVWVGDGWMDGWIRWTMEGWMEVLVGVGVVS